VQLIIYAVLFLAVAGVIGAGYKSVKDSGREEIRLEWAESNAAAQQAAEVERKRQDAIREMQDKEATKRLADAKKRSQALLTSLEAHIKVAGLRPDCRLTPELLGDANSALQGGQGVGPGAMPPKPRPPAPTR